MKHETQCIIKEKAKTLCIYKSNVIQKERQQIKDNKSKHFNFKIYSTHSSH